jgi:hypothetical protein
MPDVGPVATVAGLTGGYLEESCTSACAVPLSTLFHVHSSVRGSGNSRASALVRPSVLEAPGAFLLVWVCRLHNINIVDAEGSTKF